MFAQIRYLVVNLNKKNQKSSTSELAQLTLEIHHHRRGKLQVVINHDRSLRRKDTIRNLKRLIEVLIR